MWRPPLSVPAENEEWVLETRVLPCFLILDLHFSLKQLYFSIISETAIGCWGMTFAFCKAHSWETDSCYSSGCSRTQYVAQAGLKDVFLLTPTGYWDDKCLLSHPAKAQASVLSQLWDWNGITLAEVLVSSSVSQWIAECSDSLSLAHLLLLGPFCHFEVRISGLPCGLVMLDCEKDTFLFNSEICIYKNAYVWKYHNEAFPCNLKIN